MPLQLNDLELKIQIKALIEGICSWLNCQILIKGF